MMNTYKAAYEYLEADNTVRSIDIVFAAETPTEAINSSVRFWEGRNKALPEWWHEVLCVQVYTYAIEPVGEDGSIRGGLGFRLFEWKCDNFGGISLRDFAQYMAQKLGQ